MKFPGFPKEDIRLFKAVMDAVIREILVNKLDIKPEEVAERFAEAALGGERDYTRLKALTLGAMKVSGSDLLLPN